MIFRGRGGLRLFPPLHAWKLEKSQIENILGNEALVSLTDHDNIDAGLHLSVLDETRHCPLSVEWTVPYLANIFPYRRA